MINIRNNKENGMKSKDYSEELSHDDWLYNDKCICIT